MKIERLLVVDSSIENPKFMQQCAVDLKFDPANVIVVADGEEALTVAKDFRPQLVCTAWEIEPMPGTVFVQRLRKVPKCHYVTVLIYSKKLTDNDIAIVLVNKGEFEKGIKTYRDAMQILSDSSKLHLLHFNLGLASRKQGDHEEAFKAFCESYIENPSYEKAYANLVAESRSLKEAGPNRTPNW